MIAPWKNEKVRAAYQRPEIRASLEIILSVFTVVFMLVLAIRPTLATVATLQKKIEDQTIVDNKLGIKISQLAKANADIGKYVDRIPDYFLAVTDIPDQSGVAKRIELLAKENGLYINSIIFNAIPLVGQQINLSSKEKTAEKPIMEPGGKIAVYEFTFDVSGSSSQIFDFLAKIENLDRILLLTNVILRKEQVKGVVTLGTAVNNIHAIGRGNAYYVLTGKP